MARRSRGRHRATSPLLRRTAKLAGVAGVAGAAALTVLPAGAANAATPSTWQKVAQCESSGNWSINTGNGFYGGLQFTQSTWSGFGGTAYAPRADLASPAQQMAIANKVLAVQGWNAWPVCSHKAGVAGTPTTGGSTVVEADTHHAVPVAAPQTAAPSSGDHDGDADNAGTAVAQPATGAGYTVRSGDTLSSIAASHGVAGGWQALYQANRSVVGSNPNYIVPGQHLTLP